MKQGNKRITTEQKRAIVEQFDALRGKGESLDAVLEKLDTSKSTIYAYRKQLTTEKPKRKTRTTKPAPYLAHVEATPPTTEHKIACIIGTPAEIATVLRGLQ